MAERPIIGIDESELSRKIAELPGNSRSASDKEERRKVQPITNGNVKIKQKGTFKQAMKSLVQGDAESAKKYVVYDVLIPGARSLIYDMLTKGLQMIVYGSVKNTSRSNSNRTYVSYGNFYQRSESSIRDRDDRRPVQNNKAKECNFGDIIFETKSEAEDVLSAMDDLVKDYGSVSIAELCEMTRLPSQFTDNNYGWTDMRQAKVIAARDGFMIELPKPEYLDN